ncbi:class I tRNA ligase family protein, partial [Candidatus Bathyarchaeota archaeon]|nr:class I tRNA ligase family protein [Candidatus Bathyarchaeota archaeon]
LMALDLPLPRRLLTHAHWTLSGKKMSKSVGNGVSPAYATNRFGVDTVRYVLMRRGAIRDDAVWDNDTVATVYRTELMGKYGNLMSRTMKTKRWSVVGSVESEAEAVAEGKVQDPCPLGLDTLRDEVAEQMDALRPDKALALIMDTFDKVCNHFVLLSKSTAS